MSSFDRDLYRSDDPAFERDYAAEADDYRKRVKEDALHEMSDPSPHGSAQSGAIGSNDPSLDHPD